MAGISERISRRELLGTVGTAVSASVAGCGVCAFSPRVYDDLLRLAVRDVREEAGAYRGTVRVRHRGPGDWDGGDDRENFPTTYEDVTVYGYTGNGRESISIEIGDVEPGTIEERSFRTDSLPAVVLASPDDVTYDDDCVHAETGSEVLIYVGEYSTPPNELWDRSSERLETKWPNVYGENRLDDLVSEFEATDSDHVWLSFDDFRAGSDVPLGAGVFERAWCVHRMIAGREHEPPPSFEAVDNASTWIERDEEIGFKIYRSLNLLLNTDSFDPPETVPGPVRQLYESTDWSEQNTASQSVDLDEWKRLVSLMETDEDPEQPPCGENVFCRDRNRDQGHCSRGALTRRFSFETEDRDEPSGVTFYYQWVGVER